MAGFMEKMSNVFFKDEEEYYEDEVENVEQPPVEPQRNVWAEPEARKQKKTQIVSIPNTTTNRKSMEMALFKAKSYDDMQTIAKNIKERKVVIVNFEDMDKETAQRMVDFLSGAVFALDGLPKKVSGSTFLFSSNQVDLEGQIMEGEAKNAFEGVTNYNIWKK